MGAVEVALELAAKPNDIHVVHVIPPIIAAEPGVIWDTIDDASRIVHAREEMKTKLEAYAEGMELNVGVGDPGHIVCDLAEEVHAGLIVIPSHGRTGISRMVLGSVAERVVRHAHCPVLVLKKSKDEEK